VKRATSNGCCEEPSPVDDPVTIVDSNAATVDGTTTYRFVRKLDSGVEGVLNLLEYRGGVNMIWARCRQAGEATIFEGHVSNTPQYNIGADGLVIDLFVVAMDSSPYNLPDSNAPIRLSLFVRRFRLDLHFRLDSPGFSLRPVHSSWLALLARSELFRSWHLHPRSPIVSLSRPVDLQ
jgi:hypothetical protein